MKTVSMWAYSCGAREINIHDVEPELFEKLRPVFAEGWPEGTGRVSVDENTTIIFYKKPDDDGKDEKCQDL
jgi:hypothetical protein